MQLAAAAVAASMLMVPIARAGQTAGTGTVQGRVRVTGTTPGNPYIRMGADPMCAVATRGKRPLQEYFVRDETGGLANVFVKVDGKFPASAVPVDPVVLDQVAC